MIGRCFGQSLLNRTKEYSKVEKSNVLYKESVEVVESIRSAMSVRYRARVLLKKPMIRQVKCQWSKHHAF